MSGFKKAKPLQAALKIGIYGPPGSGKTFTSLLIAEGLAAATRKRIAYVDTERGTDFYAQAVSSRAVHPDAFDFDAIYSRSLSEVIAACKTIDTDRYSVVILDSVTHLWEAAIAAYRGKKTRAGTIPMSGWGGIKAPYKDLMSWLLSSPLHVILVGRQGVEYATDSETGEMSSIGFKMKAEGETAYEPHILLRMEAPKSVAGQTATIMAYAEKDRTGVLSGRTFANPTYESLCSQLLPLLGIEQAQIPSADDVAMRDVESMAEQAQNKAAKSEAVRRRFAAKFDLASTEDELKSAGKEINHAMKSTMVRADVLNLGEHYRRRMIEIERGGLILEASDSGDGAEDGGE